MCGFEPRILSRSSCCRPVMTARAITTAMTPTVTPRVEISEMTEMNACLRLASRYLNAMWSSKGISMSRVTLSHQRKQDDVADGEAVGQQHHEPVDPDALAGCGRQAVLERADVVVVHVVGFEVAARAIGQLLFEPPALLSGIIELAEGVCHFETADEQLESFDRVWIIGLLLREWRDLGWKVVDKRRLNEALLTQRFEDAGRELAGPVTLLDLEAQCPGHVCRAITV